MEVYRKVHRKGREGMILKVTFELMFESVVWLRSQMFMFQVYCASSGTTVHTDAAHTDAVHTDAAHTDAMQSCG